MTCASGEAVGLEPLSVSCKPLTRPGGVRAPTNTRPLPFSDSLSASPALFLSSDAHGTAWPRSGQGGPPLVWEAKALGGSYSAPSVAGGRIFGMSYRGDEEVVWALDESGGKEQWVTPIATASRNIGRPGQEGSRCTPTVDGDLWVGDARRP